MSEIYRNRDAKAKVILFHGVGTNGRQMTTIICRPLSEDGFEVIALDMPFYGETVVNRNMTVTFSDWVECSSGYVDHELSRDDVLLAGKTGTAEIKAPKDDLVWVKFK